MAIRNLKDSFRYSDDELKVLMNMLGIPEFMDSDLGWAIFCRWIGELPKERDLPQILARKLEEIAANYLGSLGVRTPSGSYQDEQWEKEIDMDPDYVRQTTRRIANLAAEMHRLLSARHPFRITFAGAFGEIYELERDRDNKLFIMDELKKIAGGVDIVEQSYEIWLKKHLPSFLDYVSRLCALWEYWTDSKAGGSKGGGPAAEFVAAAANPLIRFGRANGIKIRPGNRELFEEQAGELIRQSRMRREKESKGD